MQKARETERKTHSRTQKALQVRAHTHIHSGRRKVAQQQLNYTYAQVCLCALSLARMRLKCAAFWGLLVERIPCGTCVWVLEREPAENRGES